MRSMPQSPGGCRHALQTPKRDELRVCGPPEMADLASSQTEVGRSASRQFRRLKSCEHSVHPLRGSKLVAAPDYEFRGQ